MQGGAKVTCHTGNMSSVVCATLCTYTQEVRDRQKIANSKLTKLPVSGTDFKNVWCYTSTHPTHMPS